MNAEKSDNLSRLLNLADALQGEAPDGMMSERASVCRYVADELRNKRARLAEAEALIQEIYSYAEDQGMETLMDMVDAADSASAAPEVKP